MPPPSDLLNSEEVCQLLRVSRPTLHRYVKNGTLKPKRLPGGRLRFDRQQALSVFNGALKPNPAQDRPPSTVAFAKDILRTLRHHHGSTSRDEASVALTLINLIESRAPESELWTSSPDAADVTAESRLGDHLYITRKHFGLTC